MNAGQPGAGTWGTTIVHAAGSLRAPFTVLGACFERDFHCALTLHFAAAGLLKDRLLAGEPSSLFASANLEHPQALVAAGVGRTVQIFTRNRLCLLATSAFARGASSDPGSDAVSSAQRLADRLLDRGVRIGTSTPGADPSGDYAWRLFDRIEASGDAPAGSANDLKAKALQLTGHGDKTTAHGGRSRYGQLLSAGQADVFITYRSNAAQACVDFSELRLLDLPTAWAVEAHYGLTLLEARPAGGAAFAAMLLAGPGQVVLQAHGFGGA